MSVGRSVITFLTRSPNVRLRAETAEAASSLFTCTIVLAGFRGARVCWGKDGDLLVLFSASLPPWPDFSSCIFWLQKDAFLGATPHVTCAYAPAQRPQEQLWIVAEFIARSNRSQLWVWSSSAPFAISTMELWWGKSLPLIRDRFNTVAVAEVDALRATCYPGNLSLSTWYGDLWIWHCPAHNRALNLPWKSHPPPVYCIIPCGTSLPKGAGTCWESLKCCSFYHGQPPHSAPGCNSNWCWGQPCTNYYRQRCYGQPL